jgi:hypothetical protein
MHHKTAIKYGSIMSFAAGYEERVGRPLYEERCLNLILKEHGHPAHEGHGRDAHATAEQVYTSGIGGWRCLIGICASAILGFPLCWPSVALGEPPFVLTVFEGSCWLVASRPI